MVMRQPPRRNYPAPARPRVVAPPPMLRPYQREGVDWLKANSYRALLADAPGVGKTPQVLVAIREDARLLCPALVVAPASVVYNWQREASRWLAGARTYIVEDTSTPLPTAHPHLMICSWDVLAARSAELAARGFRLVVADEGHYAKNEEAHRSQALALLCSRAPHRLVVTGTPLVNDPDELRVLQELLGVQNPPMLRRLLEEVCPEIPPKQRVMLQVTMPATLRAEYDRVALEFEDWIARYFAKVMDDPHGAENAATRALASEPLAKLSYLRRVLGRGKVPAAAAWVLSHVQRGDSVVVFGEHADVLDFFMRALTVLGIPYVRLDGKASKMERQTAVDDFQAGKIKVFVGSSAAHVGITLHRAKHVLFLERWFTSAAEEQAEDRVRRFGQMKPTTMWYLQAEDTIDDRIAHIVEAKRALVASTIRAVDTETVDAPGGIAAWERVRALADVVPTVEAQPSSRIELPKMPAPQFVHAVLFDSGRWPMAETIRALRIAGYAAKETTQQGKIIRVVVRMNTSFRRGTLREIRIGEGMAVLGGVPAAAASRAQNRRATRQSWKIKLHPSRSPGRPR